MGTGRGTKFMRGGSKMRFLKRFDFWLAIIFAGLFISCLPRNVEEIHWLSLMLTASGALLASISAAREL